MNNNNNNDTEEEVYCFCRRTMDVDEYMICCDSCDQWFHGVCVEITEQESADIDQFFCPQCSTTKQLQTTRKKQCANPNCKRPFRAAASMALKYCSDDCGIAVAKMRLLRLWKAESRTTNGDNDTPDAGEEQHFQVLRILAEDGTDASDGQENHPDRVRLQQLEEEWKRRHKYLEALEKRRDFLVQVVRFADAFSARWLDASPDGEEEEDREPSISVEHPICGFDQRLVGVRFQQQHDESTNTEASGENLLETLKSQPSLSRSQLLRLLPESVCRQPRLKCPRHHHGQLPKKSLLDSLRAASMDAAEDIALASRFRSPGWAHLQLHGFELEWVQQRHVLDELELEKKRLAERMSERQKNLVRMRLENKSDPDERWHHASMVLMAAPSALPPSSDPILTATTICHRHRVDR